MSELERELSKEEYESCDGVHKETFMQGAQPGIPRHWVVFYWGENECPLTSFHDAAYFGSLDAAVEFEKSLQSFEDWSGSQEEILATQ